MKRIFPGRRLKLFHRILFMGLVAFTVISCGGMDQPGRDAQDRWLSAKCPPTEICGPQTYPETLVIAWLDASKNDLCSVLTKYTSPDRIGIIPNYCGAVEGYDIETISVNETDSGKNNNSNLKEVKIRGVWSSHLLEIAIPGERGLFLLRRLVAIGS